MHVNCPASCGLCDPKAAAREELALVLSSLPAGEQPALTQEFTLTEADGRKRVAYAVIRQGQDAAAAALAFG
jgi:hypothetical protein